MCPQRAAARLIRRPGRGRRSGRSAFDGSRDPLEGAAHGLPVPGGAIVDAGHPRTVRPGVLGPQVVRPLRDPAATLDWLDAIPPGRVVHAVHRAAEREAAARLGFDDGPLGGPLMIAVAVVSVERRADGRSVDAVVPVAGMALLGPFPHSGDVRDRRVHRGWGGSDVARHFEPHNHVNSSSCIVRDLVGPGAPP
ncbi:hypothetical protein RHCRD62_20427 [Rhodococcus sp. RD6.2]|nr:hypothetical protein RHCRD62_20427 [Rhodococcus sp. RD6.2]